MWMVFAAVAVNLGSAGWILWHLRRVCQLYSALINLCLQAMTMRCSPSTMYVVLRTLYSDDEP
jgi:hypothetical protein